MISQGAAKMSIVLNEYYEEEGEIVFREACKLGCEGIVSKRLGSPYRSGRSTHWVKVKNPKAPAVKARVGGLGPLNMFAPNPNRSFAATLLLSAIVFGVVAIGATLLWAVTGWLWLIVHQGLH
jgi:hypothetical protein